MWGKKLQIESNSSGINECKTVWLFDLIVSREIWKIFQKNCYVLIKSLILNISLIINLLLSLSLSLTVGGGLYSIYKNLDVDKNKYLNKFCNGANKICEGGSSKKKQTKLIVDLTQFSLCSTFCVSGIFNQPWTWD